MTGPIRFGSTNPDLLVAVAEARGVDIGAAGPSLTALVDDLLEERARGGFPPEETRRAVRDLLRHGGFKPTGRNKPASEYLARTATDGVFPRINNIVDACNYYSLLTGFPISLLDLDRALEGEGEGGCVRALEIREGREGESFVFNPSGQRIDVGGLVCVARENGPPLANGVKDSMATKTTPETRGVLAVLFATRRLVDEAQTAAMACEMADLLRIHGGASSVDAWVLPEHPGSGVFRPAP